MSWKNQFLPTLGVRHWQRKGNPIIRVAKVGLERYNYRRWLNLYGNYSITLSGNMAASDLQNIFCRQNKDKSSQLKICQEQKRSVFLIHQTNQKRDRVPGFRGRSPDTSRSATSPPLPSTPLWRNPNVRWSRRYRLSVIWSSERKHLISGGPGSRYPEE